MDGGFTGMTSKDGSAGAFSLLHALRYWIPAFAGMTSKSGLRRDDERKRQSSRKFRMVLRQPGFDIGEQCLRCRKRLAQFARFDILA